jgi:hypothetical protein
MSFQILQFGLILVPRAIFTRSLVDTDWTRFQILAFWSSPRNCADLKSSPVFTPTHPPLAKPFTKEYHSVVTQSLITAYAIFCSLKFLVAAHVFGDTICLKNRKMIKIVTLFDLHVVLTSDCWHCFLVFNIWVSHALEMTINFYYPTLELFCFSLTQPFTHSKFCLPNPLLFGATPAINNDRSLTNFRTRTTIR